MHANNKSSNFTLDNSNNLANVYLSLEEINWLIMDIARNKPINFVVEKMQPVTIEEQMAHFHRKKKLT